MPVVGDMIGKYRLLEVLGEGGSCRVYRGQHTRLPLMVAVKVLLMSCADDPFTLSQLREEAAMLAQLNHPNVIRLWDFDDEAEHPYIITELVEGQTLLQLVESCGPISSEWAVYLMSQVADGLLAAHQLGVVHRDIKPGNILVTQSGLAKIVDLGLAIVNRPQLAGQSMTPTSLSVTGTAGYLAPEQARDASICDYRSDMYSLGATFYHALTGRLPFEGKSRMSVILKHIQEPLVPACELNPAIAPQVSAVICRLMAKDPNNRYLSYDELSDHLREVAISLPQR